MHSYRHSFWRWCDKPMPTRYSWPQVENMIFHCSLKCKTFSFFIQNKKDIVFYSFVYKAFLSEFVFCFWMVDLVIFGQLIHFFNYIKTAKSVEYVISSLDTYDSIKLKDQTLTLHKVTDWNKTMQLRQRFCS